MSRALRRTLAAAACGATLACSSSPGGNGQTLLGLEGRDRAVLEDTYPPGTPRDVVRARESEALVFSIHECNFGGIDEDPAIAEAVAAFQEAYPDTTPRCDRVRLARTGWVTIVGGLAYYQDYVFYDAADQVLVAYRTFIQRSARP